MACFLSALTAEVWNDLVGLCGTRRFKSVENGADSRPGPLRSLIIGSGERGGDLEAAFRTLGAGPAT